MTLRERFDTLFTECADPWGYLTNWYEFRKRQLLLACLPRQHYQSGFEPACANGVLTLELSTRCTQLLSCDLSPVAVQAARARTCHAANVRIDVRELPADWPAQAFDLIVLSEFLGFLGDDGIRQMARDASSSLDDNGAVVLCHWRHPMDHGYASGDRVHTVFGEVVHLPRLLRHEEDDFLLEVWSHGAGKTHIGEPRALRSSELAAFKV